MLCLPSARVVLSLTCAASIVWPALRQMLLLFFHFLQPDDVAPHSCHFDGLLNAAWSWSRSVQAHVQAMGAGGSTGSRSSPVTAAPISHQKTPEPRISTPVESPTPEHSSPHVHNPGPPTPSCCGHYKSNHGQLDELVVPEVSVCTRPNSIDDEIEEIVANTLDLEQSLSNKKMIEHRKNTLQNGSANGAVSEHRRSFNGRTASTESEEDSLDDSTTNDAAKEMQEALKEVDFAKFKKVNHKACGVQRNGRILHQQDSDLLWRLGLISPETYTMNKTRSAPTSHGHNLKPPSYDLTEEQLMANIEKEFAELTGTVN